MDPVRNILGIRKDRRSRNQEDDDVEFRGPHRKARENES